MTKVLKVYIATGIDNKIFAELFSLLLESHQFNNVKLKVISRWHRPEIDPIENVGGRAAMDFGDIDRSDIVIAVYPYGANGTICEMTYAFTTGKHIIYLRNEIHEDYDPLITGLFNIDNKGIIIDNVNELINYLDYYFVGDNNNE